MDALPLSPAAVENILVQAGVDQYGHFTLNSGLCSGRYLDKDALSANTRAMNSLCAEIARRFFNKGVEVVVGPELGAIVAAHVVAQHLNAMHFAATGKEPVVPVIAVKTKDGGFEIRKSMRRHVLGKRALVMEDILTTGGSARKVIDATLAAGAVTVVGLAVFCNRGAVTKADVGLAEDAEFEALLEITIPTYTPGGCPMHKDNVPISDEFGHGGKK